MKSDTHGKWLKGLQRAGAAACTLPEQLTAVCHICALEEKSRQVQVVQSSVSAPSKALLISVQSLLLFPRLATIPLRDPPHQLTGTGHMRCTRRTCSGVGWRCRAGRGQLQEPELRA